MEADFRSILLGNAKLIAIIGERMFFAVQPQDERRPRILIRLSHYQHRTLTGAINAYTTRASIDALASRYSDAAALAVSLRNSLQDVRFLKQGETHFRHIASDDAEDIPQMPQAGKETATFGRNVRAVIEWEHIA